jgi:hypothetical protein|tara:strand:- start:215 stop:616 length:402 start_codon:yes stop_codon:yes gene_type:complete
MKIEVSNGELLDKVSILRLKLQHITDDEKRTHALKEHQELVVEMMNLTDSLPDKDTEHDYLQLFDKLMEVNSVLWSLEDRIREKEKRNNFDQDFIEIARAIYFKNDERASIKRKINELTDSSFVEVKSYSEYQ